ncbi:MAG: porin [Deltaproteobacteria bacterium]|nr:porin [Deltaproteobacteria bacterium]
MKKLILVALVLMLSATVLAAGPSIETADGKYKIGLGLEFQSQFQWLSIEGQGKADSFQIRRGRVVFVGHAFTEELTYKFQLEAVGGQTSIASPNRALAAPTLRDAYINYDFGNGVELMTGQFKPYFNRQEFCSSTKNQFVDDSLLNEVFSFGRDVGFALHGDVLDEKLEYAIFVTNDAANRNTTNSNKHLLAGGRLVYNVMGKHGYTMSDVEDSSEHHLAVGLAANHNKVTTGNSSLIAASGDIAYRHHGFSALGEGDFLNNSTLGTYTYGFLAQAGYFLTPKHWEVAGRFAGIIPTAAGVTNGYETGLALNYYFYGHNLKLQTDYNFLINSALRMGTLAAAGINAPTNIVVTGGASGFIQNQNDHRIRTQLQLYF